MTTTKLSWALGLLLAGVASCGGGDPADPACDDGVQNGDETDVDCGGTCGACTDGAACAVADDCASDDCNAGTCAEAACGDGRKQAGEDCDDGGETAGCNDDCTASTCGDGVMNATAGEECEGPDEEVSARCAAVCILGAGLDGTFGDTWEPLAAPGGTIAGLQSFHYSGSPFLYDFTNNMKYDIAENSWSAIAAAIPWSGDSYWANAAAMSDALYVARDSKMFRFDLVLETWTTVSDSVPNGNDQQGATIVDGAGNLWFHGPGTDLVRFSAVSGALTFPHDAFDVYEARMAYDPITNRIAMSGYDNDRFLVFDIATHEFVEGTPNPGGEIHDNACQDASGGIYTGSGDFTKMFRYDIGADTWTDLPLLPTIHDNNSSCVVSQDGYLYFATYDATPEFWRLPLGKK